MSERDRPAFINYASGTSSPTSREWVVAADQWMQTYYQVRDGRLYLVHNDNKEQTCREEELAIDAFVREHGATATSPYPDVIAYLAGLRGGR